jgi:hypothetical protein
MDLMNDKSVPEVLKAKMMAVVEGKRPSSFSPVVDSVIVQPMDNGGKVYLETLNKDGGIIERKEYSSLDEAQKADKKLEYEKTLGLASVLEGEFHNEFTQDLEERLNMQYMEAAQNPDMDKYRIPQGTAKQMLLYDEAPVYRLLPSGSEKIAPIAAISTGLWYENYREFAIAPEDLGALDKLIRRETDRLTGNLPQLHKNEERRPAPER